MFTFTSAQLDRFYRDPVMALYCITGMELDSFQMARLRLYWFVPHKVDSSGWGTGKTVCEWGYAILRAVLIPGQQIGVYYPIFQTGKDTWWKYFSDIRHPVLEAQYRPKKHEWKDPGSWRCEFKNGSMIQLPAPGFLSDSKSQASRTFNTMIIGEYTQAAAMGEGVDELIGRVRGPNFNKAHPIWANHTLLSAHAESPTHPAYRYYKGVRDCVLGKHTRTEQHTNGTFTASFMDWSDRATRGSTFRKLYRDDAQINKTKRSSSKDQIRRVLLGLWSMDGKGWYAADMIKTVLRSVIRPQCVRKLREEIFVLGQDIAPGQSGKADSSASFVWRVVEVAKMEDCTETVDGHYFHISARFCHQMKNVDAGQTSGFIHGLHRAFGFAAIVIDMGAGGGGPWVYKELIKPRQLIFNEWCEVTPLCMRTEPNMEGKEAIVVPFKRSSDLDVLWPAKFQQGDEGIIEAAHRTLKEGFEAQEFEWPQLKENRDPADFGSMSHDEQWAQIHLDTAWRQATGVRVKVHPDGTPMLSGRGFYRFEAQGAAKKDAIYAGMYGYAGVKLVLKNLVGDAQAYEDDVVMAGG